MRGGGHQDLNVPAKEVHSMSSLALGLDSHVFSCDSIRDPAGVISAHSSPIVTGSRSETSAAGLENEQEDLIEIYLLQLALDLEHHGRIAAAFEHAIENGIVMLHQEVGPCPPAARTPGKTAVMTGSPLITLTPWWLLRRNAAR
jgi:hypothetical protein